MSILFASDFFEKLTWIAKKKSRMSCSRSTDSLFLTVMYVVTTQMSKSMIMKKHTVGAYRSIKDVVGGEKN